MTKKIRFVDDPLPIMPDWLIDYPIGAKFGWGLVCKRAVNPMVPNLF